MVRVKVVQAQVKQMQQRSTTAFAPCVQFLFCLGTWRKLLARKPVFLQMNAASSDGDCSEYFHEESMQDLCTLLGPTCFSMTIFQWLPADS